jgi:hypothetical protein
MESYGSLQGSQEHSPGPHPETVHNPIDATSSYSPVINFNIILPSVYMLS